MYRLLRALYAILLVVAGILSLKFLSELMLFFPAH
jgi:hypothetical protein